MVKKLIKCEMCGLSNYKNFYLNIKIVNSLGISQSKERNICIYCLEASENIIIDLFDLDNI